MGSLGGLGCKDGEERERCWRLKKHGMKCKHPQYYKSLWLRWAEKGQAGTHGKNASSFDLRSERVSHCGQISVPRL
jgi:hypothetical protein